MELPEIRRKAIMNQMLVSPPQTHIPNGRVHLREFPGTLGWSHYECNGHLSKRTTPQTPLFLLPFKDSVRWQSSVNQGTGLL